MLDVLEKGVTLEVSSLPGQTDTLLPIWDTVDTPYLSCMEIPVDEKELDTLVDRSTEAQELNSGAKNRVLDSIGQYLWEVIEKSLTQKQFQIFYLYYMYNLTQWEISEVLDISQGSVSQMLHISETRLRKRIGESYAGIFRLS